MFTRRQLAGVCAAALLATPAAWAQTLEAPASTYSPTVGQQGKDVIWVPTQQALIDRMLDMAEVTQQDYLVDLGSGDGRTVITAAKRGLRAHGIEYNPDMVALSKRAAANEGVAERATFEQADIFESDFSKASVVTLFLLPDLNLKLRPTLLDMKPGTRVVSNSFMMGDWQPDASVESGPTANCSSFCRAPLWIIPAKAAGVWDLGNQGQLELKQTYQALEGTLTQGSRAIPLQDAKLKGSEITFVADGKRYAGTLEGTRINGRVDGGSSWSGSRKNSG